MPNAIQFTILQLHGLHVQWTQPLSLLYVSKDRKVLTTSIITGPGKNMRLQGSDRIKFHTAVGCLPSLCASCQARDCWFRRPPTFLGSQLPTPSHTLNLSEHPLPHLSDSFLRMPAENDSNV